jgi:FAD/FMN-containing dehydrogenase
MRGAARAIIKRAVLAATTNMDSVMFAEIEPRVETVPLPPRSRVEAALVTSVQYHRTAAFCCIRLHSFRGSMNSRLLARLVKGRVLEPDEAGYDEVRSIWNARFDRRPDVVVRCRDVADVEASVGFARDECLTLSVKGGGHSYAGNTVADGGLLIDLSLMKAVRVDAETRGVIVEPGVTCGELDRATQAHGLATPSPTVSSVGVAGAALGGGSGYLSRRYGLTLDNLISVDVVTADGRRLRSAEDEHPDLFSGLRGAGANFGVVTSLELRLHAVGPLVLAGQIIYPFENASELLRFFRDFMADAPDEFQCFPFMFRIPPIELFPEQFHGQPALDFVLYHLDPNAADFVQPLRDLGETILDIVGPLPYTGVQQSFDANLPKGQRYYSKAHYLDELPDTAIDTIAAHVADMQGAFTVAYLEPLGGAIGRVDPSATAFEGRKARYSVHVLAGWTDPADDDSVMNWARIFHGAMSAHATGGVYVNLLAEDEDDRVPAAYGHNYQRLVALKTAWDRDNLFRMNYNISPSA